MKTDKEIQSDVMDELRWEPMLDSAEIGVAVHHGIVTLSGTTDSYLKKVTAEKAAERVKDVKAVAVDIEVLFGTESARTDTQIAEEAVAVLQWNSMLAPEQIFVEVDNGWVSLSGNVRWQYQRKAAEVAVQELAGVRGVSNLIAIMRPLNAAVVKDRIRRALERNADVEASQIHIETVNSTVILKGKVGSLSERTIVENAAWSSPGITAVENRLLIGS